MSENDVQLGSTCIFSVLVQDDSGESQVVTTSIQDDLVESQISEIYDKPLELTESIDDCE
jgi:hypothetical protein